MDERTVLEIIAPSVEEAVEKGCADLGLSQDQVTVEILDSGSKGLFGLGGRQARIRLRVKGDEVEEELPVTEEAWDEEEEEEESAAVRPVQNSMHPVLDDDYLVQVARDIVRDLVDKMRVHAKVSARWIETGSEETPRTILVEIQGEDLSILIGRRSETLNALQYIAGLIITKEVGHWVPFSIDVQGYRSRRERQLRQLALRMADQCIATGHRQVLEPMPANERRIIHLTLRDHASVYTESVGEEPNRKVCILLKK